MGSETDTWTINLGWPASSRRGLFAQWAGCDHFLLEIWIKTQREKFDYFPYFFEISAIFWFVQNRIILHGGNGGIKDIELGMRIEIEGEGKEKEGKGWKKTDLTWAENFVWHWVKTEDLGEYMESGNCLLRSMNSAQLTITQDLAKPQSRELVSSEWVAWNLSSSAMQGSWGQRYMHPGGWRASH